MKKTLVSAAAIALALSAGSAFAADLPSHKAPPYIPPPPPLWTGFYLGVNAGYTWSESNSVRIGTGSAGFNPVQPAAPIFAANYALLSSGVFPANHGGFIGGGQIGYNWQFANTFVVGVEADIQGIAGSSSGSSTVSGLVDQGGNRIASVVSVQKNLDYLGTVRGRLGFLFTPSLLVYGTGGLAYGGVTTSANIAQIISGSLIAPGFGAGSFSDTRVGWTVGGGLEWMFWPNWSAKVEYLYYDLGNVTYGVSPVAPILQPPALGAGAAMFVNFPQATTRFDGHIVRAGLNYHFNWGAPAPAVYAKY